MDTFGALDLKKKQKKTLDYTCLLTMSKSLYIHEPQQKCLNFSCSEITIQRWKLHFKHLWNKMALIFLLRLILLSLQKRIAFTKSTLFF